MWWVLLSCLSGGVSTSMKYYEEAKRIRTKALGEKGFGSLIQTTHRATVVKKKEEQQI
jgi:hypothetical protein